MPDKKINILKLAGSYGIINGNSIHSNPELAKSWFMRYSIDLCKQVLELSLDNIDFDKCFAYSSERNYYDEIEESIINTINQIE